MGKYFGWLVLVVTLSGVGLGPACRAASKDERWVRVVAPEFTIVTSLKEAEAMAWATEFAQYVAALQSLFKQVGKRPPLTIVVFARERDFEPYRPLGPNGKPQKLAGFFLRHESWAVVGLAGAQFKEEVRHVIFHEGVHWFLSMAEQRSPMWLEEGTAEVFSTFDVTKNKAEWGRPIDWHVALLQYERPLPLRRLLFAGQSELFGDDSIRTSLVYAEAWAFVHFLLFGKNNLPKTSLADYSNLVQQGMVPEKAFQQAFGRSYEEMDRQLAEYVSSGKYFIRNSPLVAVAAPKVEPATPLELADALGRLAIGARLWDLAATHARTAINAAPDDPRGHEILGFALKGKDQSAEALAEFSVAVEKHSRDFQPYFELAFAAQSAAASPLNGGNIAPGEARIIANRYEKAINLNPRFLLSYQNLTGVIGIAEPWSEEDRNFLAFGLRLFPDDAMIRIGLAILTRRGGDAAAARAELDRLQAGDLPSSARGYARRLDDAWEQEEVLGNLNRLVEAKKWSEAIAYIDQQLAVNGSAALRIQLVGMQRQLAFAATAKELEDALQASRWIEARRLVAVILASEAPVMAKSQARRTLSQLDRDKLGLEGGKSPVERR